MLSEVRWAGYTLGGSHPGLHVINVRVPDQLDSAFSAATQQKVSAMTVLADPMFLSHRARIADLAVKSRLPTIFNWRQYAEAGGLLAYGPSVEEMWLRAPTFVDKVLLAADCLQPSLVPRYGLRQQLKAGVRRTANQCTAKTSDWRMRK